MAFQLPRPYTSNPRRNPWCSSPVQLPELNVILFSSSLFHALGTKGSGCSPKTLSLREPQR